MGDRQGKGRISQGSVLTVITLVVLLATGIWLWSLDWVKQTLDGRFTEQARRQPYLVAERFLQEWGLAFEKEQGFSRLDGNNPERPLPSTDETLLLLNAYGQLSEHRAANLIDWVEGGGHLIVSAENPFVGLGAWVETPLFDHFGIAVEAVEGGGPGGIESEPSCDALDEPATFTVGEDDRELEMAMAGDRVLRLAEDREVRMVADGLGPRLVQMDAGQGMVTFIASAALWRNAYLGCHDHAYLLWQLMPDQSMLRILHNLEGPSLWQLIRDRASLAALSLLLGILLLLWHHGVRFGPVREPAGAGGRSLLEHVRAAGHFAWRHKRQAHLAQSIRESVESLAAQTIPGFRALDPDGRYRLLARHAGLEESAVAHAMAGHLTDERAFLAAIQTLKALRERL